MSPETLFEYQDGLHLRETLLWFDASTPRQLCFISHANVPGASGHQKVLATDKTVQLLRAVGAAHGRGRRAHEPQALVSPYGRPFSLGQLSLELFPSGYILGAASLLVTHRDRRIVYAGNINPSKSPLVDRLEARSCDVLVLSCPFGSRRYVFPPLEQATEALVRFAKDSLNRGETPVLLCSPLGEAQLVLHALSRAEIPSHAHREIFAATRVYQDAGLSLGAVRRFSAGGEPAALVWPIRLHGSAALGRLSHTRRALVSGLALDQDACKQMGCEAAFAISAHGDYPAHLEYVRACEPRHVVLSQGANRELREDLEALGLKVSTVGRPQQMSLF
jgi:putative mRNA 3-end processing factor